MRSWKTKSCVAANLFADLREVFSLMSNALPRIPTCSPGHAMSKVRTILYFREHLKSNLAACTCAAYNRRPLYVKLSDCGQKLIHSERAVLREQNQHKRHGT